MTQRQHEEYDPSFDEALLAHYDDNMDYTGYAATLERMRRNGCHPCGPGAPLPGSTYYQAPPRRRNG